MSRDEEIANAARVVACVNGCKDVPNPAALGELVKAAKRAWVKSKIEYNKGIFEDHNETVTDKDENWSEFEHLLAALRACGIEVE